MTDLEKKVLDRYRDFRIALEELYFYNFATRNVATSETNGLMSAADKAKLDRLDLIVADLQIQAGGSSSYALKSALDAEISTRNQSDLSLQNQIRDEIANRATADTQIYNQLQSSLSSLEMEFYGALSGLEVELPIAGASIPGCICVGNGLVMSGDTLSVVREGGNIVVNGKIVGVKQEVIGKIKVVEVNSDYAICRAEAESSSLIHKGDVVKRST